MYRSMTDLGNRLEDAKREAYRIVAGVRGDISDNWSYEISGNYGEFKEATKVLGNVNYQRYLLSSAAVVAPATGNVVCRSQIDQIGRANVRTTVTNAQLVCRLRLDKKNQHHE